LYEAARGPLLCYGIAFGLLLGCSPQPYALKTPFDEADFASYGKKGSATLHGQAFLVTNGGEVKKGAGKHILRIDDMPEANEFMRTPWIRTGSRLASSCGERLGSVVRSFDSHQRHGGKLTKWLQARSAGLSEAAPLFVHACRASNVIKT
jgi:hypothetical protein